MQVRPVLFEGKAFEGMPDGVPQIQGFAYAMLQGVLTYDVLLNLYAFGHQGLEGGVVHVVQVETEKFGPMFVGADKSVFEHFRITGCQVLIVECAQEIGVYEHTVCWCKCSNFVFQSVEVDTRFSPDRSIDHGEQGGGDIDIGNAPFEGRGGESPQVGDHASTYVQHQGMSGTSVAAQVGPYLGQCVQCLVGVCGTDGDIVGFLQARSVLDEGQAESCRTLIGKDEQLVVGDAANGFRQVLFQTLG